MGHKSSPIGLRLGINRTWDSRWYHDRTYGDVLLRDLELRQLIRKRVAHAGVSRVVIERFAAKTVVTIESSRPGVLIGKRGGSIDELKKVLSKLDDGNVVVNVLEVRKPEINAMLVAQSVAEQLERRVAFRRAMKRAMQNAMRMGALGVRIATKGRLGGAEIARTEWYKDGRVPLHTLRADVDYGWAEAHTTYGTCGVKVWIYKGEIFGQRASDMLRASSGSGGERR